MKKTLKTLIISCITTSALITAASAANLGGGVVTASSLNFRAEPSTDATILACAPYNSSVIITEKTSDEWYAVLYNGAKGYMCSEYIECTEELEFESVEGKLNGDGVRFRNDASYESDTITYLYTGQTVTVTGINGEWYQATYNGETGYLHSDFVLLSDTSSSVRSISSEQCSNGQSIAEWAKEFLGTSYIYGGSSPKGFDCSGFTYYLYNNSGYKINRTASTQWYDGEQVSKDELMVGDLVFFSSDSSSSIEHVGIYIGDGQFIHSSSGGGCVRINSLSDYYYNKNWYGAVRVL